MHDQHSLMLFVIITLTLAVRDYLSPKPNRDKDYHKLSITQPRQETYLNIFFEIRLN